jgi:DnaK suppressor protein
MLEARRLALQSEIEAKKRDVRDTAAATAPDLDPEVGDSGAFADIEFALIHMRGELVVKITDALSRLERGDYGTCEDCAEEIAEKRLRALPFAVRCKTCQDEFEAAEQRRRHLESRSRLAYFGVRADRLNG